MSFLSNVLRQLEELRRQMDLIRHGLVRQGVVQAVDATAGTVVVEYHAEESEPKYRSLPMPWLQRSTEHRPPAVGDHALVLDPSMGNGGALAICGWPSTAKPPAGGGGSVDVLHRDRSAEHYDTYAAGTRTVKADVVVVESPDISLGESPTDFVALAELVLAELQDIKTDLDGVKSSFDTHTHGGVFGGTGSAPGLTTPPSSGPTGTPPISIPTPHTPASVAAEQVRAK